MPHELSGLTRGDTHTSNYDDQSPMSCRGRCPGTSMAMSARTGHAHMVSLIITLVLIALADVAATCTPRLSTALPRTTALTPAPVNEPCYGGNAVGAWCDSCTSYHATQSIWQGTHTRMRARVRAHTHLNTPFMCVCGVPRSSVPLVQTWCAAFAPTRASRSTAGRCQAIKITTRAAAIRPRAVPAP